MDDRLAAAIQLLQQAYPDKQFAKPDQNTLQFLQAGIISFPIPKLHAIPPLVIVHLDASACLKNWCAIIFSGFMLSPLQGIWHFFSWHSPKRPYLEN
jgi:hypothetical protein